MLKDKGFIWWDGWVFVWSRVGEVFWEGELARFIVWSVGRCFFGGEYGNGESSSLCLYVWEMIEGSVISVGVGLEVCMAPFAMGAVMYLL